jgi:hypothetical protein
MASKEKKRRLRQLLKIAAIGALVGWFVKRKRSGKSEEWREMFEADKSV